MRGRGVRNYLLIVAVAAAIALPQPSSAASAPAAKRVVFFGDSITYESGGLIAAHLRKHPAWQFRFVAVPGVAVCQMLAPLRAQLTKFHPQLVVLQTMGNSSVKTPCMDNSAGVAKAFGSAAWLDQYRADLGAFFRIATQARVKVLFTQPLPAADAVHDAGLTQLMHAAAAEARRFDGVSVTAAARDALSDAGAFTATKPCLPSEGAAQGCDAATHTIGIRAPDGIHLCTAGLDPVSQKCSVYSSGEVRFARAMVFAVLHPPLPLLP